MEAAYSGRMRRYSIIVLCVLLGACHSDIYVREGVTDGDTFALGVAANGALGFDAAVTVNGAFPKSTCQLELGGENPARASSYGCELTARSHLLDAWDEQLARDPGASDEYLDALNRVREAGHLDEYVVYYFGTRHWQVPAEVDMRGFRQWQDRHLGHHKASTRIVGSWNYRERVIEATGASLE